MPPVSKVYAELTAERLERRCMRHLYGGQFERAEINARRLIERDPGHASGWAALRGALAAQGKPSDAEAMAAGMEPPSPEVTDVIDRIAAQRLSWRGLVFDASERLRVRPMADFLGPAPTAAALRAGSDVVWSMDPGGDLIEYDPVLDLDGAAGPAFSWRYRTGPKFVAAIDGAAVVGWGLVLTRDGEFLEEINPACKTRKYDARREGDELVFEEPAAHWGRRAVKVFDTPAFLMAGPTDTAFGDWMVNFFPRLALYEAAGLDCPILLRWKPQPHTLPILEALGVPSERLIFHEPHQTSLFPKLYAPCWPSRDKVAPMAGTFDIYRRAALPPPPERPLLYLDRRGLGARPLANEEEICQLFARRGFQIVSPGQLDLDQTRRLFAAPACVAGPFGSAFLNMAFTANHPAVLALMPSHLPRHLQEMALWQGDWGNRFAYVLGEPAEPGSLTAPWTLSLEKVERALDRMMELISSQGALAGG